MLKNFLSGLLTISLIGVMLLWMNYTYWAEPYQLKVYRMDNLKKTLQQLEEDKVIFSAKWISRILFLSGYDKKIKKGIYEIDNHMGVYKIISILVKGKEKKIFFTIKEGEDIYDIAANLFQKKIIPSPKKWLKLVHSPAQLDKVRKLLGFTPQLKLINLEGFLYPDTYLIHATDSAEKIIDLALGEFKVKINNKLNKLNIPEKKRLAYFTVASLIEKETYLPKEKPLVASVIFNRLKDKIKLRIDPTIIYALKVKGLYHSNLKEGKINIKKEHFQLSSPYNTYYIKGLPITPIASFSDSSLQAAIHPAKSNYYFFVAKARGKLEQGHYFSVNYDDHLRNIRRSLRRK